MTGDKCLVMCVHIPLTQTHSLCVCTAPESASKTLALCSGVYSTHTPWGIVDIPMRQCIHYRSKVHGVLSCLQLVPLFSWTLRAVYKDTELLLVPQCSLSSLLGNNFQFGMSY